MLNDLVRDAIELSRATAGGVTARSVLRAVLAHDSYAILAMFRARTTAMRFHIPGMNRVLRLAQTAIFGIEIGKDVSLGHGVYFVHTLGIVLGGDARIGNRVKFMGNNTVGTAKDNGYPVIEDDAVIGAGARILGPIRIGAGAIIGANAVVVADVPAGAVAFGIPAKIRDSATVANSWAPKGPKSGVAG